MTKKLATLDQIQDIFGSSIAGNHTVHATLEDGAVVCSCDTEFGLALFIGHDVNLSDYDMISLAEFKSLTKGAK